MQFHKKIICLIMILTVGILINQTTHGADGSFYLSFPISEYNSSSAPISSVFDHSMSSPYSKDDIVIAYTGEKGNYQDYGGNCDCYNQSNGQSFTINGNYRGARSCGGTKYLCYDGHPGIDYVFDYGTGLYPAISGRVSYKDPSSGTSNASKYHTLRIDPEDGSNYKVYYLHLSSWLDTTSEKVMKRSSSGIESECTDCPKEGEWVDVNRTQPIGYVGNYQNGWGGVSTHLHFDVEKNGIPVDPYGWKGSGSDPYEEAMGVTNIDLWTVPSNTITHTLTTPSKTTVNRGGILGPFTVEESNNSDSYYSFYVQPYVIKPYGTYIYFEQILTGLDAGETRTLYGFLFIPSSSELGTFTFGVEYTDTDGNTMGNDSFEFTVISGSSYASNRIGRKLKRLTRNPELQIVEADGWKAVIIPMKNK